MSDPVEYNLQQPYSVDLWKQIQSTINVVAKADLNVDGIPGQLTADAIKDYQNKFGLTVDGKAGPMLLYSLNLGMQRLPGSQPDGFFYYGSMAIDADGSPNAYNPYNTGIDNNANANKFLGTQGPDDPCPGYYISATSLAFDSKKRPSSYVNAVAVPYIVLPGNLSQYVRVPNLKLGDLAVVTRIDDPACMTFAIYADNGPRLKVGSKHVLGPNGSWEGSVALSWALNHNPYSNGKANISIEDGVFYVVFPGSGAGLERSPSTINYVIAEQGRQVFEAWGGMAGLRQAMYLSGACDPSR